MRKQRSIEETRDANRRIEDEAGGAGKIDAEIDGGDGRQKPGRQEEGREKEKSCFINSSQVALSKSNRLHAIKMKYLCKIWAELAGRLNRNGIELRAEPSNGNKVARKISQLYLHISQMFINFLLLFGR